MSSSSRDVVLVPWDYDAGCSPVPWNRSYLWAPPGKRGVYSGLLRDSSLWVSGVPTLDVFQPEFHPYAPRTDSTRPWLSLEEYLEAISLLPGFDQYNADPIKAFSDLEHWAAMESRGSRIPLKSILDFYRVQIGLDWYQTLPIPVAGTYRVNVRGRGGISMEFYARSGATFMGGPSPDTEEDTLQVVTTGEFTAVHTTRSDGLAFARESAGDLVEVYHSVGLDAVVRTMDSVVWLGRFNAAPVAGLLAPEASRAAWRSVVQAGDTAMAAGLARDKGRWIRRFGRPVEFDWVVAVGVDTIFAVHAVQVSQDILR